MLGYYESIEGEIVKSGRIKNWIIVIHFSLDIPNKLFFYVCYGKLYNYYNLESIKRAFYLCPKNLLQKNPKKDIFCVKQKQKACKILFFMFL